MAIARSSSIPLVLCFTLFGFTVDSTPCLAQADVNFINGGEFTAAVNWDDGNVPTDDFDRHFVQDDLTASFSTGETLVFQLTIGDTSRGVLNVSGGNLEISGTDRFEVGRSTGGEGIVNVASGGTLTADGAIVGTRSLGVVNIAPGGLFDLKEEEDGDRDIRIGTFGPGFNPVGEPDLDGDGLVVVEGTLDGATAIISQSGARGELRLVGGGTIDLVNGITMNLCENCANSVGRQAKVSVIGSGGTFNVGGQGIRADLPSAILSFTADTAGVTPLVVASSVEINNGTLELDLDDFQFTPTSTLTLIEAIPSLLDGEFQTINFLGSTTADVNYDNFGTGRVFLSNFQSVAVAGDYNGNGIVDLADYTVWRDTLGSTTNLVANGDNTGASANKIDGADYIFWKSRFGATSTAGTLTTNSIPEPASFLLAVFAVLVASRHIGNDVVRALSLGQNRA